MPMIPPTVAEVRAAQLAHVLARAVRDGEVGVPDALRVLRHELRRRNTNKKLKIPTRSRGAQTVIDKYGAAGAPKNDSDDALHADHVHPLTEATLRDTDTVEKWVVELRRVQMVVCVTAAENYRLEVLEWSGTTGLGSTRSPASSSRPTNCPGSSKRLEGQRPVAWTTPDAGTAVSPSRVTR